MPDRLSMVVSEILEIPADRVTDDVSPDNVPQWDSLRTVGLAFALEETFGIHLNTEEIVSMRTIGALRQLLRVKGIAKI